MSQFAYENQGRITVCRQNHFFSISYIPMYNIHLYNIWHFRAGLIETISRCWVCVQAQGLHLLQRHLCLLGLCLRLYILFLLQHQTQKIPGTYSQMFPGWRGAGLAVLQNNWKKPYSSALRPPFIFSTCFQANQQRVTAADEEEATESRKTNLQETLSVDNKAFVEEGRTTLETQHCR